METPSAESAPRSAPFSGFPSGGFFFRGLHIEEILTTLRANIEARRSLTAVIGEGGSGKTALLNNLTADLRGDVIPIRTSNPRLNFTGILRLIQFTLDPELSAAEEDALLAICKYCLRARRRQKQIIVLILDNAHHLAESTLSRLAQSFTETGPQDYDGPLLQVVFAGRPQLKTVLLQAAQSPPSQRPVICELGPLRGFEVASYIEQGLRAAGLPSKLFELSAVEQIARSSNGNPARVNALCNRALQIVGTSSSGQMTAELIQTIAHDLHMGDARAQDHELVREKIGPAEKDNSTEFQFGEPSATDVVGETFLHYHTGYDRNRLLQPRRIIRSVAPLVALLALAAGAGAWSQTKPGASQLTRVSRALSQIFPSLYRIAEPPRAQSFSAPMALPAIPEEPFPSASHPAAQERESNVPQAEQPRTTAEAPGDAAEETFGSSEAAPPRAPAPTQKRNFPPTQANTFEPRDKLEAKIIQAISHRAIIGVGVSVVGGTAILEGHVASERQRRAAERAARSVDGIERVRNRITVSVG